MVSIKFFESMAPTRRRRRARGRFLATVTALATAIAFAGCSSPASPQEQSSTGSEANIPHLTWALQATIGSLDPAQAYGAASMSITQLMLEPLVRIDPTGKLVPNLAEEWSQPDTTTIDFKIRTDVTFWDGSPLTPEDVAYSINRIIDPAVAAQNAGLYPDLIAAEVTAPDSVQVRLKQPSPEFVGTLSQAYIMQKEFAESAGSELGTSEGLNMGTGAYVPSNFSPTDGITLTRNSDYWGTLPTVEEMDVKFITDSQSLLLAAQSGEIDGTIGIPLSSVRSWEAVPDFNLTFAPDVRPTLLMINTAIPPFDDVHARRAIANLIDQEGIVNAVYGGLAGPARSIISADLWSNLEPSEDTEQFYESLPEIAYDEQAARDELAQSRTPDGFSLEVTVPSDSNTEFTAVMEILKEAAAPVGIDIELKKVPGAQWLAGQSMAAENPPLGIISFGASSPTPMNLALTILPEGSPYTGYRSDIVDEQMALYKESTDPAEQLDAARTLAEQLSTDLPFVPIVFAEIGMGLSSDYVYSAPLSGFINYGGTNWASYIKAAE